MGMSEVHDVVTVNDKGGSLVRSTRGGIRCWRVISIHRKSTNAVLINGVSQISYAPGEFRQHRFGGGKQLPPYVVSLAAAAS